MSRISGNGMEIEYDEKAGGYYILWQPVIAVGAGGTQTEALEDLRAAAHLGVDTVIDLELGEVYLKTEVENDHQG